MSSQTALSDHDIEDFGIALHEAGVLRRPLPPLTGERPDITIEDAYRIQLATIKFRQQATGEAVVGKKIGVTSRAVMEMLDVHQPDFGHLLANMLHDDGATLAFDTFVAPRAEGEIAFLLKADLVGPGVTVADVLAATASVAACIEIVDSRIADWRIRIQDTVADNASAGAVVLGTERADPMLLDLATIGMTFERNGEVVGTGAGAAALGHPANAVAWLANTLGSLGVPLRAGEVVLSGALSGLVPVERGDELRVSLGRLGSATARFS